MESIPEKVVTALLTETEMAHGAYETTVLGGVYDQDCPTWYAAYLLDHGLGDHFPRAEALDVANLAAKLSRLARTTSKENRSVPGRMSTRAKSSRDSMAVPAAKNLLPLVPQKFKLFKPIKLFELFVEVV